MVTIPVLNIYNDNEDGNIRMEERTGKRLVLEYYHHLLF